jgi:hypothetical protein
MESKIKTALVTFKVRVNPDKFKEMNPEHSGKIQEIVVDFIEEIETIGRESENPNHFQEQGFEIMCDNYKII